MKTKLLSDHHVIQSVTCGELHEVLANGEYGKLDLAVAIDIQPTTGHYHETFDEIYFVMDGAIELTTYSPEHDRIDKIALSANELCLIPKGTHHKVTSASEKNRLLVLSIPRWVAGDEVLSDRI